MVGCEVCHLCMTKTTKAITPWLAISVSFQKRFCIQLAIRVDQYSILYSKPNY